MLIIYRKSDGLVISNSGTNSLMPDGPPFDAEVQNAIRKLGGLATDYAEYRLNDVTDVATVQAILDAGSYTLTFDAQGSPTGVQIWPKLTAAAAPNPAAVNATVTLTVTLPAGTPDTSATFQVEGGQTYAEPVTNSQASHAYAFALPGTYLVTVSSAHHGAQVVEVAVE